MFGPGYWSPNTRGFTDTRSPGLTKGQRSIAGVLVFTNSAIIVEQWDEKTSKYQIIKRFWLSQKRDITLDTFGLNRRVVVQWNDYSTDSFSFTGNSGQMINSRKTESLFDLLSSGNRPGGIDH